MRASGMVEMANIEMANEKGFSKAAKAPKSEFNIIAVTGTPGTGKTTLAKELSLLLHYVYVDAGLLVKEAGLSEGYDRKRKSLVVDTKRLNKALIGLINRLKRASEKGAVIDSHMSHFLPSKLVDLCIVTKCSLKTLKRRLEAKGYSKAKVRENLDAEIFDVCLTEAQELGHKILVADTEKSIKEDLKSIKKTLNL